MTGMVKIVIVEDHPIVRLGLATVLGAHEDLSVVAEATDSGAALAAVANTSPDLVILPLRLGGVRDGLELCREIKSFELGPRVMMYTSYTSHSDATLAFLSGADSFLTKDHPEGRLVETVRATARGSRVWNVTTDTGVSARSLEERVQRTALTAREQEVLGFMLQRYTNSEIAKELFVGVPTVKTHVSNVLQKLGIDSRRALFG
ncbi:DNA-binding response regulator [Leucobacter aridicollis]|uniref:NarL family two-component system response regulator LiaR n=2 Tax=Leucobacter aridicollis TaxID=283878 RepID=A0A852RP61_9MICO|nr:DNA-binding response regulator [Leucobacter aridicollis]NYD28432.1 NarL family two-component system response regulator LiaR [Leucobacter aridicollis]